MASRINVGASGEHYVAGLLSALGYHAALVRGGAKAIDLLVSDPAGSWALPIQVKTASWARREPKRVKHKTRWEWQISVNAHTQVDDGVLYAFVNLAGWPAPGGCPSVFWVPGAKVHGGVRWWREQRAKEGKKPPTQMFHWIMDAEGGHYSSLDRLHEAIAAVKAPA